MSDIYSHLTPGLASAFARQLAFADLTGELAWQVDIPSGTVTFGGGLTFPIQLLGTESHRDRTWLWAWANSGSGLPDEVLRAALWLRDYGARYGLAELTEPGMGLGEVDGHLLAMLAGALTGRCYYRGPYEGGALFFLVEDAPPQVSAPAAPERVLRVLGQVIETYPVDHRVLVEGFLPQQGFEVTGTPEGLEARRADGMHLRVVLDGHGRITDMTAQVSPA
ncbi:DUF6882 domain-containing protein [Planomonospora corallina]|uniref:DUF6882 domain-containing protein n=1 Tax=Planomonospora corallina TaxID=1806052 RepID=A0ABV8HZU8_9ACTN